MGKARDEEEELMETMDRVSLFDGQLPLLTVLVRQRHDSFAMGLIVKRRNPESQADEPVMDGHIQSPQNTSQDDHTEDTPNQDLSMRVFRSCPQLTAGLGQR